MLIPGLGKTGGTAKPRLVARAQSVPRRLPQLGEGLCALLVGKLSIVGMSLMPAFQRGDTLPQSQLAQSSSRRSGEISAANTALTQVTLRDRIQLNDEVLHEAG